MGVWVSRLGGVNGLQGKERGGAAAPPTSLGKPGAKKSHSKGSHVESSEMAIHEDVIGLMLLKRQMVRPLPKTRSARTNSKQSCK